MTGRFRATGDDLGGALRRLHAATTCQALPMPLDRDQEADIIARVVSGIGSGLGDVSN